MKRIEVKLSLTVVAPLLDVIKSAADTLKDRLAVPVTLDDVDLELRSEWREELVTEQTEEINTLLSLFDSDFFATGVVGFDESNAIVIVRACSAVRLRLRERYLAKLPDEVLEGGDVELSVLDEKVRKAFMCYLFLATVQELIIQHLDSAILDT